MKKRIMAALMVSSIVLGTVVLPTVSLADDFDTQIEKSTQKINELSSKEAAAASQLASVKATIEGIKAEAEVLQGEQAKLNTEITTLGNEIDELAEKIEKRDVTIKEQARSIQVSGKADNYVNAILSADSISSAITRFAAATRLVNASNDLMKQQEEDKNLVEVKQTETEEKAEKVNQKAISLESKKGELVDQELQQAALVNQIAAERSTEEGKKSEYLAAKQEAEAQRAEEARLREVAQANAIAVAAATEETTTTVDNTNSNTNTGTTNSGNGGNTSNTGNTGNTGNSGNTGNTGNSGSTGNGGNGGTTQPTPPTTTPTPPPPPSSSVSSSAILAEAAKHIGVPYVWGGKTPSGFDCSGFTSYVFMQAAGRSIGGNTTAQEGAGTVISLSQVQPGDLLFWGSAGSTSHVAIATTAGGSGYIHAPRPGQSVTYGSSQYFAPNWAVRVN